MEEEKEEKEEEKEENCQSYIISPTGAFPLISGGCWYRFVGSIREVMSLLRGVLGSSVYICLGHLWMLP